MGMAAISQFLDRCGADPDLKGKVQAALRERGDAAPFEIVDLARAEGCEFTATELREYVAGESSRELTDLELEAVAGGLLKVRALLPALRQVRFISPSTLRAGRFDTP